MLSGTLTAIRPDAVIVLVRTISDKAESESQPNQNDPTERHERRCQAEVKP
jgi:hypothetical protein